MEKNKLNRKFLAALWIFSLTGQIAWVIENMYFNVFIYKMFNADANAISMMVAASAVSATITTVIIGALSDKIGKRKIFICGGYILWGITILSFALIRKDVLQVIFPAASTAAVGITLVIIMDCVMTFFGSSANDACFNAWLTDLTDNTNRGTAEGINSMMPLLAMLAVFGGFMSFDLNKAESWTVIYLIIGIAVFLIGIIGIFLIDESGKKISENKNYFSNIVYGFRPSVIKQNKILYITLGAFAVFGISIQIFMPYLILYYNVTLKMDNYVIIMAPAILIGAIFTALYGRLYDKHGFKKTIIPSIVLLCIGYIMLYIFKSTAFVFIGSLLMICGFLSGTAIFGAMIRDYTPAGKAGMFQGLRIVGQVLIPGIIGPAVGAYVLRNAETIINDDGTTSFVPNANIYMAALAVAVMLFIVLFIQFAVMRKEVKKHE
ncbi:MAG: MFS transporter [Ruminococcaceae bacterium]|nr:MFS transporter [Oscillospiraceae bacterium]